MSICASALRGENYNEETKISLCLETALGPGSNPQGPPFLLLVVSYQLLGAPELAEIWTGGLLSPISSLPPETDIVTIQSTLEQSEKCVVSDRSLKCEMCTVQLPPFTDCRQRKTYTVTNEGKLLNLQHSFH